MVSGHACDVVVIGGGPAGLASATDLARNGRHVVLLEEHEQIGYPVHCTGLVGLQAFEELGLSRESVRAVVDVAGFRLNEGAPLLIRNERLGAAVIDRGAFDAELAWHAAAAGADIRVGSRADRVHVSTTGVSVHTRNRGVIHARAAVLACGANYRFNRALGLGVPRAYLQSAQLEVSGRLAEHVSVFFGNQVAPGGFGWVVPFQRDGIEHSRIGLMCGDHVAARFEALGQRIASLSGTATSSWPSPRRRLLPLGPVGRTFATRVLAVGDAAGLVKPTTGGGIYYSLLTGAMAARVLNERLDDDRLLAEDLEAYERLWRDRLGAEIRIGLAFRTLAAKFSDRAIHALLELARVDGLVPLLNEHADFNWHRGAALALLRNAAFRRIVLSHLWT